MAELKKTQGITHDSAPSASDIILTEAEQGRIGKYIRECEVDRMQATHYEKMYTDCNRSVDRQPTAMDTILRSVLLIAIGYTIGVNH